MKCNAQPAPAQELVRFLAVFHRFLTATEGYSTRADRSGVLLGGWLADALHNVPFLLRHYSLDAWHSPAKMDAC